MRTYHDQDGNVYYIAWMCSTEHGERFGTVRQNHTHTSPFTPMTRVDSLFLPLRETHEEAVADLASYATRKHWEVHDVDV